MSLATIFSRAEAGIHAPLVHVEVHLANGLPRLSIVGLPEAAVKESKDRVRAALINSRFKFPSRHITINLAPADLPKEGGRFDLPIALGILAASGQLPHQELSEYEFIGELGLSGELREIRGALPVALQTSKLNRNLIVPYGNATEAALAVGSKIFPARHLLEICAHLSGGERISQHQVETTSSFNSHDLDLADVRGQHQAKRTLEVAAAGAHNLLMVGPPGTGKTMLASRLPGILPPMTESEAVEAAAISSISHHKFSVDNWLSRSFRAPHHTCSGVALVGGGSHPKPGEISLAHHGVLFLDELTEFDRRALDVLREPLETGHITISRAARQAEFPADFQLVAAMNPCPQGYDCDLAENCQCSPEQQRRHRTRISAPLLDRIDLQIFIPHVERKALHSNAVNGEVEHSQVVRERVIAARQFQLKRTGKPNAAMTTREVETMCRLNNANQTLLDQAVSRLKLSARAYHRILKVARTIADLGNKAEINTSHLSEAISYRALDRTP